MKEARDNDEPDERRSSIAIDNESAALILHIFRNINALKTLLGGAASPETKHLLDIANKLSELLNAATQSEDMAVLSRDIGMAVTYTQTAIKLNEANPPNAILTQHLTDTLSGLQSLHRQLTA